MLGLMKCRLISAVTWNVTCTYSQFLAPKTPSCCVSLSSFYNDTTVNCPTCSCGCQNPSGSNCVKWVETLFTLGFHWSSYIFFPLHIHCNKLGAFDSKGSPRLRSVIDGPGKWSGEPLVECTCSTSHTCPVKINWHVKQNNKDYWRVKITITNLNFRMNYTEWNLVVQHPNFDNITQLFGVNYKPLTPYGGDISE